MVENRKPQQEQQMANAMMVEQQSEEVGPAEKIKIVRASCRIRIDLRRKADAPDRAACDSLHALLSETQKACATASNALARDLYTKETQSLAALGRLPKTAAEWPMPQANGYQIVRAWAPSLNPGIASAIARAVHKKWSKERWATFVHQTRSPVHYHSDGTFPLRAQELRLRPLAGKGAHGGAQYELSAPLEAGSGKRIAFPLEARDEYMRGLLSALSEGRMKLGDARVERDRMRHRRWYLRLAYTRLVAREKGDLRASINRGMHAFLVAYIEGGERWIYDGEDIAAYLAQIQRRRKSFQRGIKASNRVGHGRPRALKSIEHLAGKAERWRQTRCQVIARRLAGWMADQGVTVVYIEDFTGIRDSPPETLETESKYIWDRIQEWPYYQLQERLVSCLEEYGIRVEQNPLGLAISSRCPFCGGPAKRDLKHWKLRCLAPQPCRSEHLDVGAAENGLARGSATDPTGPREIKDLAPWAPEENGGARRANGKGAKSKVSGGARRNGK